MQYIDGMARHSGPFKRKNLGPMIQITSRGKFLSSPQSLSPSSSSLFLSFTFLFISSKISLPFPNDRVKISALALLKMAMHAKSGGNIEVMGVMQGKVQGDAFIVIDAFALPVEGTETRVNAAAEAYEYMVDFQETAKLAGRRENIVGWYHSHPGYGCWLSGIDVGTQMTNQRYQEPFLAVVIDPHRTIAAGKVDLGAFRTYPEDYKPPDESPSQYQTIPIDKIEDFGVHVKQYYQLEVSYFKSSLDSHLLDGLWGRYWASTLSSSPLLAMTGLVEDQIVDVSRKLEAATAQPGNRIDGGRYFMSSTVSGGSLSSGNESLRKGNSKLAQVSVDGSSVASELMRGVSTQVIRQMLFNRQRKSCQVDGDSNQPATGEMRIDGKSIMTANGRSSRPHEGSIDGSSRQPMDVE